LFPWFYFVLSFSFQLGGTESASDSSSSFQLDFASDLASNPFASEPKKGDEASSLSTITSSDFSFGTSSFNPFANVDAPTAFDSPPEFTFSDSKDNTVHETAHYPTFIYSFGKKVFMDQKAPDVEEAADTVMSMEQPEEDSLVTPTSHHQAFVLDPVRARLTLEPQVSSIVVCLLLVSWSTAVVCVQSATFARQLRRT
jgi:hypothetical protein